jgi:hypothetical protein
MNRQKSVATFLLIGLTLLQAPSAKASGHGPVFSLATPTNGKGGWSLDLGVMGRRGVNETGIMFRGMLAYGMTEDLMISASAPVVFNSAPLAPGRLTGMMPGTGDFEGIVSWRFHRQGTNIGSRFESTAYGGIILPGFQKAAGLLGDLKKAPGIWTAIATGLASRSYYFWIGAGYKHFAESKGDKRPDLLYYSLVWGYRPRALRKDYPHWDWRLLVELTGEKSNHIRRQGIEIPGTGGHQIFIGPTTLGIYKNLAIEGGIQLPIYRNVGSKQRRENFRFAVNFSYFF